MTEPAAIGEETTRGRDLLVFRAGAERFATLIGTVDEAVDVDPGTVQPVPADNPALRGVFPLRGNLVPLYGPERVLGIAPPSGTTVLVVRAGAGRAALAVDDVEDVLTVADEELRAVASTADAEVVVRGVLHREGNIIAIVDLNALVTACRAGDGRERQ